MNEEIEKEFLEEFLECKQNPEDKHGIVECGSEGLWDWINKKLQQAYLQGAEDMRDAVKLDRTGGFKDEMVSIALARIDEQAQQFIDSLKGRE